MGHQKKKIIKRIRKFVKQTLCFLFNCYCATHMAFHHNGFVATHALGHMIYGSNIYVLSTVLLLWVFSRMSVGARDYAISIK